MSTSNANQLLNDLLIELHRSLLQYLAEAWPWISDDSRDLKAAVLNVVEHQREDVGKIVHLLNERRYPIDFGMYPAEYSSLHYVALEFALNRLQHHQRTLVNWIEGLQSDPELQFDSQAQELVREIAASQRTGLERLEKVELPGGTKQVAWMK